MPDEFRCEFFAEAEEFRRFLDAHQGKDYKGLDGLRRPPGFRNKMGRSWVYFNFFAWWFFFVRALTSFLMSAIGSFLSRGKRMVAPSA